MPTIVILSGSPSPSSRLTGVIRYLETQLTRHDVRVDHLAVVSLPAEALIHGQFDSPEIIQANALIESADAVIVASPVYKASFTGVLKTYLDLLPQKGLAGKRVAPIFIGGSIAHLLAIDYGLKPVLSALGARHFVTGVYAVDSQIERAQENGELTFTLHDELTARLDITVRELLGDLGVATA